MDKEAIAKLEREFKERDRLKAPYERALGKLSIRFSLLHLLLEEFGWRLWGLNNHVGSILTKDLPTKHLVRKIRDSAELFSADKTVRKELVTILNRAEKAAERRNDFLHSIWVIKEGEPTLCISRKRGPLHDGEAPSAEDINDLSRTVMNIACDLMDIELEKSKLGLGLDSTS